jgi:hypothetical protein
MTDSIPSLRKLYLEYPSSILHDATATMGLQIRNLLLTTEHLVTTIRAKHTDDIPDLDDMEVFLSDSLDTETAWKIHPERNGAPIALQTMCEIDTEVAGLVHDYVKDIYERACRRHNQDAIPPPLVLSPTEMHRLIRAFYRLKLFGVLFYNYADRFCINLFPSYKIFFTRLSAFEIDEMNTAYEFLIRDDRHFKPAWPHIGCSFAKLNPWTDEDPFNCWKCGGQFDSMMVRDGCIRPRAVQPFCCTLQRHFIYMGRWADSGRCRALPVKQWHDVPEANGPSAGWALWHEKHERAGDGSLDEYIMGSKRWATAFGTARGNG